MKKGTTEIKTNLGEIADRLDNGLAEIEFETGRACNKNTISQNERLHKRHDLRKEFVAKTQHYPILDHPMQYAIWLESKLINQ